MTEAFERFLAGEDRLAALLYALPIYEPPASLETSFVATAQAAQASAHQLAQTTPGHIASFDATQDRPVKVRSALQMDVDKRRPNGEKSPGFEPPASLEAHFLKMAARADEAQAPRREAILTQIAAGESPHTALNADLQPVTEKWLRAQASATAPAKAKKPVRKAVFLGFSWFDLRLTGLACALAAVTTQLVLKQLPSPQEVAVRDTFNAIFLLHIQPTPEASAQAQAAQEPPAPVMESASPATPPLAAAPLARAALPENHGAQTSPRVTPSEKVTSPAVPGPHPSDSLAATPVPDFPIDSLDNRSNATVHLLAQETTLKPNEQAHDEALPEPVQARHHTLMAAKRLMPDANASPADVELKKSVPSPEHHHKATEITTPVTRLTMAPAAPSSTVPVQEAPAPLRGVTHSVFTVSLSEDPATFAQQMPSRPARQVWLAYAADPTQPEIKVWLETLRQHIPKASRPIRFTLLVKKLPPNTLHIVLPPPEAEAPATR